MRETHIGSARSHAAASSSISRTMIIHFHKISEMQTKIIISTENANSNARHYYAQINCFEKAEAAAKTTTTNDNVFLRFWKWKLNEKKKIAESLSS